MPPTWFWMTTPSPRTSNAFAANSRLSIRNSTVCRPCTAWAIDGLTEQPAEVMSIRLKLLLLGFATLVLPWAGCRYAREMESALREGEQSSLQSVAQSIASSLQGRTDLLYRQSLPVQSSEETQT